MLKEFLIKFNIKIDKILEKYIKMLLVFIIDEEIK